MSQYKTTPAQRLYLRKMYAQAAEENNVCCDCPGCDTCTGFVVRCTCDEISASDLAKYRR